MGSPRVRLSQSDTDIDEKDYEDHDGAKVKNLEAIRKSHGGVLLIY